MSAETSCRSEVRGFFLGFALVRRCGDSTQKFGPLFGNRNDSQILRRPVNFSAKLPSLSLGMGSSMQRYLDAVNRVLVSSDSRHAADQEAHREDRQILQSPDKVVLVVDDDPLMRWAVCEHLRQNNFSIVGLATAAEGYTQILKLRERISVLITDMVLPVSSGWHLAQSARCVIPDLAVIFISGAIDEQVVISASSHPRTGFLEKPFELSQLTDLLKTLLPKRTSQHDKFASEIERDQKAG